MLFGGDGDEDSPTAIVLDTKDGSTLSVPMGYSYLGDEYSYSFAFSPDDEMLFTVDGGHTTVNALDLDSKESKRYSLATGCLADGDAEAPRLQVSEDGNSLYVMSVTKSEDSDKCVAFCVYDYKKGCVTSRYQLTYGQDYDFYRSPYMSLDGKFGYVNVSHSNGGEDSDIPRTQIVTVDIKDGKVISKEADASFGEIGGDGDGPRINEDGAVVATDCFVSKEGKVYAAGTKAAPYPISFSRDGSLALSVCSNGGDSSSGKDSSFLVTKVATGETVSQSDSGLKYVPDESQCGSMTDDGAYVLTCSEDQNNNWFLSLIDTKTGAYSKVTLQGSLGYSSDYLSSAFFSPDRTKIYTVANGDSDGGYRVDVYDSHIARSSSSVSGSSSSGGLSSDDGSNMVILVVTILVLAGVGGFFALRARKKSKSEEASASDAPRSVAAQTANSPQTTCRSQAQVQPQQVPNPSDSPHFCASCGTPLVPGARFCPHCGAPVKR